MLGMVEMVMYNSVALLGSFIVIAVLAKTAGKIGDVISSFCGLKY